MKRIFIIIYIILLCGNAYSQNKKRSFNSDSTFIKYVNQIHSSIKLSKVNLVNENFFPLFSSSVDTLASKINYIQLDDDYIVGIAQNLLSAKFEGEDLKSSNIVIYSLKTNEFMILLADPSINSNCERVGVFNLLPYTIEAYVFSENHKVIGYDIFCFQLLKCHSEKTFIREINGKIFEYGKKENKYSIFSQKQYLFLNYRKFKKFLKILIKNPSNSVSKKQWEESNATRNVFVQLVEDK